MFVINHETPNGTSVDGVFSSETEAKIAAEKLAKCEFGQSCKKIDTPNKIKVIDGVEHVFRPCRKVLYSNDTDFITINEIFYRSN